MPARLHSFAKINLGLAIGPTRPDGFHALATVYQTIALSDVVTLEARRAAETRITLTSNDPRVPLDGRNTAWRMAERALAVAGATALVAIHIEKRLPVQGGLGAGSANAAAALLGLERELSLHLSQAQRMQLAAAVGSDVPLFLLGGTVWGTGRGEQVSALPDLPAMACVVAVPEVGVSTPQAFREWDARHSALTPEAATDRLERLSRSVSAAWGIAAWGEPHSSGVSSPASPTSDSWTKRGDLAENPLLALVRTGMANDFEQVVFAQYPFLADTLRVLAASGQPEDASVYAALSGSGSALFGLYRSGGAADRAAERLRARGIVALRTETLPREQYWQRMWEEV
jgi:4-diphosphocytidyl-2-C-methyl-D-erythritol kinase